MIPNGRFFKFLNLINKHPIYGIIPFLLALPYNFLAQYSLIFRSIIEPSHISHKNRIHPSVKISPWGVKIHTRVTIKNNTVIKPRTSIGRSVTVGERCVIGNAGFQVARFQDLRLPIVHTGKVIIGDFVQIGNATSVDRALFGGKTIIGSHTRIGSHTIVGHNIQIGSHCYLGDFIAIGGKSKIGDRVVIGDRVSIANRITIESESIIPAGSIITQDIRKNDETV